MAIKRVMKVGIAVRDLDGASRLFTEVLGITPATVVALESRGMRHILYHVGDSLVQLMTPSAPDSPLSNFIEKHGEGLQHIAFEVSDIEETIAQMKEKGLKFIQETPLENVDSRGKHILVNPRSFHGVLVELVEMS